VIVADRHPRLAGADVIDTEGDRLGDLGIGEVVHIDLHRLAFRLPFLPAVPEVSDRLAG